MSLHHARLNSRRWERTRKAVFTRDGYRCRSCGEPGRLEAHHLLDLRGHPHQDPYDPSGIETRCRECHIAEHRRPVSPEEAAWRVYLARMAE